MLEAAEFPKPVSRWPWQRSMQTRLALAYGAVFVVVLSLLMLAVGQVVYRTSVSEAERHLQVAAILAANSLQDPLSGYAGEFEAAGLHGGLDEPRTTEQRTQLRPPSPSTTQGMATGSALAGTLVARRL